MQLEVIDRNEHSKYKTYCCNYLNCILEQSDSRCPVSRHIIEELDPFVSRLYPVLNEKEIVVL